MADAVKEYLDSLNTSDRARRAAWDALSAPDDAEAKRRLDQLPFSTDVKRNLWDLASGGTVTNATAPTTAMPEAFMDRPNWMGMRFGEDQSAPATSRAVGNAWRQVNPVEAVKGFGRMLFQPEQTKFAMYQASQRLADKADTAPTGTERAGYRVASKLPMVGPAAAAIGEQFASGDIAGGAGATAGILAPTVAPSIGRALERPVKAVARRLYQSALKPTKAVLNDVRPAPGEDALTTLTNTGLNEGIPVSKGGLRKAGALIDSLNTEVEARLKAATARGATVDPMMVERAIADVAADFTDQINAQPDLSAIETVRQNFLANPKVSQPILPQPTIEQRTLQAVKTGRTRSVFDAPDIAPGPVPVETMQRFKQNTYKGLRGKYGVERGATIEAEKAGARAAKEGIVAQAPEVAGLNAREGQVIPLEEALSDAMRRRGNYGMFGLTPVIAAGQALASGHVMPLLAAVADRMPGLVSRGGIWINRVGSRNGKFLQASRAGNLVPQQDSQQK